MPGTFGNHGMGGRDTTSRKTIDFGLSDFMKPCEFCNF